MRRMAWCALVFLGCEGGEAPTDNGNGREPVTDETDGPAGGDWAPAYRWYDQSGEPVTAGPELVVWDESGSYLWHLDRESGEGYAPPVTPYYSDADCAGDVWVDAMEVIPLVVYEAGRLFARRADQVGEDVAPASYMPGEECYNGSGGISSISVADAIVVIPPAPAFEGPLYPGP